jgi:hypothetical protein
MTGIPGWRWTEALFSLASTWATGDSGGEITYGYGTATPDSAYEGFSFRDASASSYDFPGSTHVQFSVVAKGVGYGEGPFTTTAFDPGDTSGTFAADYLANSGNPVTVSRTYIVAVLIGDGDPYDTDVSHPQISGFTQQEPFGDNFGYVGPVGMGFASAVGGVSSGSDVITLAAVPGSSWQAWIVIQVDNGQEWGLGPIINNNESYQAGGTTIPWGPFNLSPQGDYLDFVGTLASPVPPLVFDPPYNEHVTTVGGA